MAKLTSNQKKRLSASIILFIIVTPIVFLVSDRKAAITITTAWISMIAVTRYMYMKQAAKNPVKEVSGDKEDEIPYGNKTIEYYEYIRDNRVNMKGTNHYLGWLLRDVELEQLHVIPFQVIFLWSSQSYYIHHSSADNPTIENVILALEAALNCTLKYPKGGLKTENYKDFTKKLLFEGNRVRCKMTSFMGKSAAYRNNASGEYPKLDYYTRFAIATGLEGTFTIYRFMTVFMLNWPERTAYVRVRNTPPESLVLLTSNKEEQVKLSVNLSLRDMAQVAQLVLGTAETVEKVSVELVVDSPIRKINKLKDFETGASATFTRGDLESLNKVILEGKGLAQDVFDYEYQLDDKGLFIVKSSKYPFIPALQQTAEMCKPYQIHSCNNKDFLELFFAKTPADLSYSDAVAFDLFAKEIEPFLDDTKEGTIKALSRVKELTNDEYTIEASERTINAILSDEIYPDDLDAITDTFLFYHSIMGNEIADLLTAVEEGDFTFEEYKEEVDGYLNSIKHTNTDEIVYICPSSVTKRIAYNRALTDDTRRVVILPSEYPDLLVTIIKSFIYDDICEASEIEPYVEELYRICEMNDSVIKILSEYYIKISRPDIAIKICKNALKYSVSSGDASSLAYRGAYACKEAGDIITAVALYMQTIRYNRDNKKYAANELSDLICEYPEYKDLREDELINILKEQEWAINLQESYKLCGQTPPTDDLTYDELMRTGAIYSVDEGMYDLGRDFLRELPDKDTDLIMAMAYSLYYK